eukprot:GFUD01111760.1.p2 GENE.GFUD01111760.1~~GFUD01111760.1.p2  ORF type:complete len:183 (+),score=43.07 GFUD01111760.1:89-637(+)
MERAVPGIASVTLDTAVGSGPSADVGIAAGTSMITVVVLGSVKTMHVWHQHLLHPRHLHPHHPPQVQTMVKGVRKMKTATLTIAVDLGLLRVAVNVARTLTVVLGWIVRTMSVWSRIKKKMESIAKTKLTVPMVDAVVAGMMIKHIGLARDAESVVIQKSANNGRNVRIITVFNFSTCQMFS